MVDIQFDANGTKVFANATAEAAVNYEKIAMYYDGKILSCPIVQCEITDGHCVISGIETYEDAQEIADYLDR